MGFLECLQQHPRQFEEILCRQQLPLDAEMIDLLFTIDYAEPGSNQREVQEQAIVYWRDYLQDCEGTLLLRLFEKEREGFAGVGGGVGCSAGLMVFQ